MNGLREWAMCGRKKSYNTASAAKKAAEKRSLYREFRHYACPYCTLWHITKRDLKTVECNECHASFNAWSHKLVKGLCPSCTQINESKAHNGLAPLFVLFESVLHRNSDGVQALAHFFDFLAFLEHGWTAPTWKRCQPKMPKEIKKELETLGDFHISMSRALVYLSRRQATFNTKPNDFDWFLPRSMGD